MASMGNDFPVKKVLGVYALPPPPHSHHYYVARFMDCAAPSDGLVPAPECVPSDWSTTLAIRICMMG